MAIPIILAHKNPIFHLPNTYPPQYGCHMSHVVPKALSFDLIKKFAKKKVLKRKEKEKGSFGSFE